jgi:hypothetical protein
VNRDRVLTATVAERARDLGRCGRGGEHVVGDAVNAHRLGGHRAAGLDERRPLLGDLAVLQRDACDLDDGVVGRIPAGGLDVDDHDAARGQNRHRR